MRDCQHAFRRVASRKVGPALPSLERKRNRVWFQNYWQTSPSRAYRRQVAQPARQGCACQADDFPTGWSAN